MKNIKNIILLAFCLSLTVPMSTVYAYNWNGGNATDDYKDF